MRLILAVLFATWLIFTAIGCSSLYDADGGWAENQIEERQA